MKASSGRLLPVYEGVLKAAAAAQRYGAWGSPAQPQPPECVGMGRNPPTNPHHTMATEDKDPQDTAHNEQLAKERDFKASQSNGKEASDPSAQRNVGAHGYTQRSNQKDQLENLHIGGDETHPQGGNTHHGPGEQAQGPGFEKEGSYDMGNAIRSQDQDFGEEAPSGPARPAHD